MRKGVSVWGVSYCMSNVLSTATCVWSHM